MDIAERMRGRVERSGARVEQRLELLGLVLGDGGVEALQKRLDEAQRRLGEAMEQLRREAAGR